MMSPTDAGTHWVSEILHMLMRGSTDYSTQTKEFNMLEFMDDLAKLDHMTSPRLLNSHLYIAHLPEQMIERKVKVSHHENIGKFDLVSLF